MKQLPPRLLFLLVVALLAFAMSSCDTLGIATHEYVEDRVEAVNEHTAAASEKVAESFDPILPGFAEYVGETFRNEPTRPPPPPDERFPWVEVIGIVGAAFGLSVPAAVKATNAIRDMKRKQYGEATSVKEAIALGQLPVPEISQKGTPS